MRFPLILFLYGFFYLVISSNVACGEQYCQQCGYDRIQDDNGHYHTDNYKSCITCFYPWFPNNNICHKNTCTWPCTQCDFTGNYCIACNSKYYDYSMYGCQLNSTIVGIIIALSFIILIFLTILVAYCCNLQAKKRQEMIGAIQNRNNLRLAINQRSHTHAEKNNFSEKVRRSIVDSKNICSICLEDGQTH